MRNGWHFTPHTILSDRVERKTRKHTHTIPHRRRAAALLSSHSCHDRPTDRRSPPPSLCPQLNTCLWISSFHGAAWLAWHDSAVLIWNVHRLRECCWGYKTDYWSFVSKRCRINVVDSFLSWKLEVQKFIFASHNSTPRHQWTHPSKCCPFAFTGSLWLTVIIIALPFRCLLFVVRRCLPSRTCDRYRCLLHNFVLL